MCFNRTGHCTTNVGTTGYYPWTSQRQLPIHPVPVPKNSSDSKSVIRTAPKKKAKSTSKRRRDSERLRKFRETKKVLCIFPFSNIENSELQNDFQKDSNYSNQIISLQSKLVRTKITISKISEKCAKLQRSNEILEEECARAKNVNITNYVSQIKELEKALDNRKKIMKSKDETISTLQTTAKQKEQTQRQIANLKFKISEKDEELKQKQNIITSLQKQLSYYSAPNTTRPNTFPGPRNQPQNNSRRQRPHISYENRANRLHQNRGQFN